jgi:hypothetical protein
LPDILVLIRRILIHGSPFQPCGSRSDGPSMSTVWQ